MIRPRRWSNLWAGRLSADVPYDQRIDQQESRLDAALLNMWGSMSPYLLSGIRRRQFERLADRVEAEEKNLAIMLDKQLRDCCDQLRSRLMSTGLNWDYSALAFALAREAARRHVGMRHFHVQLIGGFAMMTGALAEMQ